MIQYNTDWIFFPSNMQEKYASYIKKIGAQDADLNRLITMNARNQGKSPRTSFQSDTYSKLSGPSQYDI